MTSYILANIVPDIQAFSFAIGASRKIFETINRIPPIGSLNYRL